ncbi:hypothetical protein Fmac_031678 [Flemingia macrophylla]|uniref:Esterase n=1 Tax=Flemingia macrophylla TaxID=520843 RepID=A0ABD1L2R2_9FABA
MSLMQFPIITNFQISVMSSLVLIVLCVATATAVRATPHCDFPAIINLGASNSDTGGLAASLLAVPPPYGETYFHTPVGRFSDGRIILDFIARSFGLPYISPYLDSLGTNFSTGVNFATAGSTIKPIQVQSRLTFSPFILGIQFTQFKRFKTKTQVIRNQGGVFATLMPKQEYFDRALYTFDIGQNDLTAMFFSNMTLQQVNASVPDIVKTFTSYIKNLYDMGARSFWIHSTGPLGCLPQIMTNFPFAERDAYGCAKPYNEVCQNFNLNLKEALAQLRKELPLAAITYVDIYSAKYSLFSDPKKYGFEYPLVSCCGYGGKYNFSNNAPCGGTIKENGADIFVGSCPNPHVRVIWDGTHFTEAANKVVFDLISTGAFNDPRSPLKMACQRNIT